jgi:branched-chain amino acid transport system permease protein
MLLQIMLTGLVIGCLYALAGIGLVIIYKTSEIINFAQGDTATLTTFIAFTLLASVGLPYPVVFLSVILVAGLLGVLIYGSVVRPLVGRRTPLDVVVTTLGLAMILNGVAAWIWGYSTQNVPPPLEGRGIQIAGASLNGGDVLIVAVAVLCIAAFLGFFRATRLGIAMQAVSQNRTAAQLMGVNLDRVHGISWALGGMLAAVAGLFIAPTTFLDVTSINQFMIKAFAAVVLGGFSSFGGAILGGLVLGVGSNVAAAYLSTDLKTTFVFALMLGILAFRPAGLLGEVVRRKV